MVPFVPEFSMLDHTIDPPSRMPGASSPSAPSVSPDIVGAYTVAHVIDGDTIDVRGSDHTVQRVRFIGIDTPEIVDPTKRVQCYGPQASARMKSLLEGKTVTLASKPDEDHDAYGRLLRYVFREGEDIGAQMIREGYAVSLCKKFPHPKCDSYDDLEQRAQSLHLGRWAACMK